MRLLGFASLLLILLSSVAVFATDSAVGPPYLALGDSVSFGFITNAGFEYVNPENFIGFPDYVGQALKLQTRNAACPGETSGSFLSSTAPDDGCCYCRRFHCLSRYRWTRWRAHMQCGTAECIAAGPVRVRHPSQPVRPETDRAHSRTDLPCGKGECTIGNAIRCWCFLSNRNTRRITLRPLDESLLRTATSQKTYLAVRPIAPKKLERS